MIDDISPFSKHSRGMPNPDCGKRNREGLLGEVIADLSLLK